MKSCDNQTIGRQYDYNWRLRCQYIRDERRKIKSIWRHTGSIPMIDMLICSTTHHESCQHERWYETSSSQVYVSRTFLPECTTWAHLSFVNTDTIPIRTTNGDSWVAGTEVTKVQLTLFSKSQALNKATMQVPSKMEQRLMIFTSSIRDSKKFTSRGMHGRSPELFWKVFVISKLVSRSNAINIQIPSLNDAMTPINLPSSWSRVYHCSRRIQIVVKKVIGD